MNIALYGSRGKMGSLMIELLRSQGHTVSGVDPMDPATSLNDIPVPEVMIDFSHVSQLETVLSYALSHRTPLVIATTGYSLDQEAQIAEAAKRIPLFKSANYSYGIVVLRKLLAEAVKLLEHDFDIEVIEAHHNQKKDAPSGTAKLLVDTIQKAGSLPHPVELGHPTDEARHPHSIGVHAIRGGSIVGDHTIMFAGTQERITLTHQAESRAVFAHGAIKAAHFIIKQHPGLYSMDDLVKE
jgi:4-hydroxy-tetrahydrodipicolinate reductase